MFQSTEKSPHTEGNLEVHLKGEEIELRAHEIYIERGGADGHDVDDWLQAERELFGKYHRTEPMVKKAVAKSPVCTENSSNRLDVQYDYSELP